jgi:hypothetical protein
MTTKSKADMTCRDFDASIANGRLTISISVADLIHNARTGPGLEYMEFALGAKIEIGDEAVCARTLLEAMEHSDQLHGASFLNKLIDDAVELAIERDRPGFIVTKEKAA